MIITKLPLQVDLSYVMYGFGYYQGGEITRNYIRSTPEIIYLLKHDICD